MKSAVTISLVPESKGGPFIFSEGLEDGFARAAKFGFDAVELFLTSANQAGVKELESLSRQHGLKISAFGTGAGWVKHKLRLTDPDATVRHKAIEFIKEIISLGAAFAAPTILGSMQGRWEGAVTRAQAIDWLGEALEELGAHAADRKTPFLYEPLNRYETNMFNQVEPSLRFLSTLRTSNIQLLCDLFHMNLEEADVGAAFRAAGAKVGYVHLADSNRHAAGHGHTEFAPIIAALRDINYDGYLSAEALPLPDSDTAAKQTIKRFRELTGKSP